MLAAGAALAAHAAPIPRLQVNITATGDIHTTRVLRHVADDQNYCAVGSQPFAHVTSGGQELEVPPGPPIYEVNLGRTKSPSYFPFRVWITGYAAARSEYTSDIKIEVDLKGRHFIAFGSASGAHADVIAQGLGGDFSVDRMVLEKVDGTLDQTKTIAVSGRWICPSLSTVTE